MEDKFLVEHADLIAHGWARCNPDTFEDEPPCWHHPYFDNGNEGFATDDARESNQMIGARLAACAKGLIPDEKAFPDTYSDHFSLEERYRKARKYRESIGWMGNRQPLRKWLHKEPR